MSKLTKEQIKQEIEEMDAYVPISKIEEKLGMPPTTLQKVLSGKRELPKKWYKVLEAYFIRKPEQIKSDNKVKKEDKQQDNSAAMSEMEKQFQELLNQQKNGSNVT